jgi:hypothetical protein
LVSSRLKAVLIALAAGCTGNLDPPSLVNKLRVLAIRSAVPQPPTPDNPNPPPFSDAVPGETVQLDALVAGLDGDVDGGTDPSQLDYLWFVCTPPPGSVSVKDCASSAAQMAGLLPSCADEPAAPVCLLGATPMVTYPTPSVPIQTKQSVYVSMVVATQAAGGALGCVERLGRDQAPGDSCVVALKTLTLQPFGNDRNANPVMTTFTIKAPNQPVNDIHSTPGGLPLGTSLAVSPIASDPDRTQVLTFSWFATQKDFDHFHSGFVPPPQTPGENPDNTYTNTSGTAGRVHFWLVLRDDSGGVAWTDGFADFVQAP